MRQRFKMHWVAVAMLSVLVAACVTMQGVKMTRENRGIKFPHEKHKDVACGDCHTMEEGKEPAIPGHDMCGTCHEIDMDNAKPEQCAFCHTKEDYSVTPLAKVLPAEVKFAHGPHAAKNVECAKCHPNPDKKVRPAMEWCMDCHGKARAELNQCEVCHSEITEKTIPKFRSGKRIQHDAPQIWERMHGQQYKFDPKFCAYCHDKESFCDACHLKNPPANHTITWRRKPHGLQAQWNREKCAVCHEEDFCVRCHEKTQPMNHRSGWGFPLNRHCLNCHLPVLRNNNCAVCHEEIDHTRHGAIPSPHDLGIYPRNCAHCHPGGVPYRAPHLVNAGTRCAFCHQ